MKNFAVFTNIAKTKVGDIIVLVNIDMSELIALSLTSLDRC